MTTKEAVLQALRSCSGQYISGEELSTQLNVSRTSIWKAIKALREEGHTIEAATNNGYMLIHNNRRLTESEIRQGLSENNRNIEIHVYDSVTSTNSEAKRLALEGAADGTLVVSGQQTAGRGRLGRSFYSPKEGIYLSVIIRPRFDVSKSVLITCAAAVAVAESVKEIAGKDARIKWVNDVYVDDGKVCGILTEGMTDFESGQIEAVIIGIGVNTDVSNFPDDLKRIAGAVDGDYSASELAGAIASRTIDYAHNIEERTFIDSYRSMSTVIGKKITVYKGQYKVNPEDEIEGAAAEVKTIDDDGRLIVVYEDGTEEALSSGEITIRM
ncbi:MAG: biotin--[acetyl-CoA-carboxylase] ligase [Clostridiales bacterium]|nr:biotin--[acetyl-CoA-carboxylase] ligase [Clostridiales bacterium]